MAGGSALAKKLVIREDSEVLLVQAPEGFEMLLGDLPQGASLHRPPANSSSWDVVLFFTRESTELEKQFKQLSKTIKQNGAVWIAWPKKVSGVPTDLNGNRVREIGLEGGLVDTKVCTIDSVWSGLRFVIRLADRR
jgi:hypothetical protein